MNYIVRCKLSLRLVLKVISTRKQQAVQPCLNGHCRGRSRGVVFFCEYMISSFSCTLSSCACTLLSRTDGVVAHPRSGDGRAAIRGADRGGSGRRQARERWRARQLCRVNLLERRAPRGHIQLCGAQKSCGGGCCRGVGAKERGRARRLPFPGSRKFR